MPYLVVCPQCSAKLKAKQPVPIGSNLTCPQCKTGFRTSEPSPEVDAQGAPSAPAATTPSAPEPVATAAQPSASKPTLNVPPLPPKQGRSVASALDEMSPRRGRKEDDDIPAAQFADDEDDRPKPRRSRDRDDDDDDRRRSRRRDDDDDRPRSRRSREDDDDDRPKVRGPASDFAFDDDPKSRRSRDDDEESPGSRRSRNKDDDRPRDRGRQNRGNDDDDRPRSKGPASDFDFDDDSPRSRRDRNDDDDERPKARKSYADDDDRDDEDDRPRSSSRRKKKRGNKTLLLLLVIGGGALALILGVVLMLVIDPFGMFGGGAPSEMLAFAPADSNSITFIDLDEARSVEDFREPIAGPANASGIGIRPDEISSVITASRSGSGLFGSNAEVVVFKLHSAADQTRIINSAGGKEATASGKKYYKTNNGGGLYFPSSRVVVVAKSESTLTGLLQKDDGKVVISDDLRSAAKRANGTVATANVGPAAEGGDILGLMSLSGNGNFIPFGGPGVGPPRGPRARATVFSVRVSGNQGTGKMESTYESSDTARTVADGVRRTMETSRGSMTDIDSWNVSQSGSTVTLEIRGPIKKGKSILPFGGGKL